MSFADRTRVALNSRVYVELWQAGEEVPPQERGFWWREDDEHAEGPFQSLELALADAQERSVHLDDDRANRDCPAVAELSLVDRLRDLSDELEETLVAAREAVPTENDLLDWTDEQLLQVSQLCMKTLAERDRASGRGPRRFV